jgi:hypothetical protein
MERPSENLIKFLIYLRRELLRELPQNVKIEPFIDLGKPKGLRVVAYPIKRSTQTIECKTLRSAK